ncbi:HPr kinase/phosphorylase [Minwuia sp.]|uniref:HPr kinase/phosphorylase n=1 Tax=Minwuia sp. TaxID=2493630 RepID=UPI003A94E9B9
MSAPPVHATCIARDGRGLLITGPSGSGKSDLALRMLGRGWLLVADDRTELDRQDGKVLASAPERLAGMIEVRGLGLLRLPADQIVDQAVVTGQIRLLEPGGKIERMPAPVSARVEQVALPELRLDPFQASAPEKVEMFFRTLGEPGMLLT